jgi:hypothetical protein
VEEEAAVTGALGGGGEGIRCFEEADFEGERFGRVEFGPAKGEEGRELTPSWWCRRAFVVAVDGLDTSAWGWVGILPAEERGGDVAGADFSSKRES